MSFEPQGNIVHENIKFMGIKNVFQCFFARYLSKNSNFRPKNRVPLGRGYVKKDVIPLLIIISTTHLACISLMDIWFDVMK